MRKRMIAGMLAASMALSELLTGCADNNTPTVEKDFTEKETTIVESTTTIPPETTIPVTEAATKPATIATEPATVETTAPTIPVIYVEQETENLLTTPQRNSLNMLNYITVLTQSINESSNSRIYLDAVQSSLMNNIYPNAVDSQTQGQINNLWHTIDGYRMVSVKRERLKYIYEQNRAQALKKAIPNPLGLLSAVESKNFLKAAVSVIYMAVDSKSSYDAACSEADLKYLQDGWELDDEEAKELSDSQLNLLNYMIDMVRANDFPGEYALTENAVRDFVKWTNEDNLTRKINWLEANEDTYREFRTYWIELVKSYYQAEKYGDCLNAFQKYEDVATRIFRADYDYAEVIPMAIMAAKITMPSNKYEDFAAKYVEILCENANEEDWMLRYIAAQIYIDLYAGTNDRSYLVNACKIAYNNVNTLVDEQEALNIAYLKDIEPKEISKDATKREKEEITEYNKAIKEAREKELPPVSEAFYLNCDLLFAIVDQLNITHNDRQQIDNTIHENSAPIFLTRALDNRFWANKGITPIDGKDIEIKFDGEKITIPASCLTEKSVITANISDGTVLDDWKIESVGRPKDSTSCSEFTVTMTSAKGKKHDYKVGETITILVIPVADTPEENIEFHFETAGKKILWVFDGVTIERSVK